MATFEEIELRLDETLLSADPSHKLVSRPTPYRRGAAYTTNFRLSPDGKYVLCDFIVPGRKDGSTKGYKKEIPISLTSLTQMGFVRTVAGQEPEDPWEGF